MTASFPAWAWIALTLLAASLQAFRTAAQKWLGGSLTTGAATYVRYLFALPSCYACGDAGWGSYTVAHDVRTETLGALLEPYRAIPPGALSYVTQHPGLVFGGATLAAWF